MNLSRAQKLVKFFSSAKKFKAIEEESRRWSFTCTSCNKDSNIWEAGGVRYKAKGEPSMGVRCPNCKTAIRVKLRKIE